MTSLNNRIITLLQMKCDVASGNVKLSDKQWAETREVSNRLSGQDSERMKRRRCYLCPQSVFVYHVVVRTVVSCGATSSTGTLRDWDSFRVLTSGKGPLYMHSTGSRPRSPLCDEHERGSPLALVESWMETCLDDTR